MAIDLYHMDASIPCRSVRTVAAIIGVDLNLKETNLLTGDQMTPEYTKLNPQRTIPTLVDGDLNLTESRAVCTYLINRYAPGHSLYPLCPKRRALIDRYLYFDVGTLYRAIGDYFYPKFLYGKDFDPELEVKLKQALGFLEIFLGEQRFLLGGEISLADICIASSLTMLQATRYGLQGFPKLDAYVKRVSSIPQWDGIHLEGIRKFRETFVDKKHS